MTGTVRTVLRATVQLDRRGLRGRDGLRTALGVGLPLLVGVLLERPVDGLAAAGGAFSAGYAVFATGYRARLSAVLLATVGVAASTFVGAAVTGIGWLLPLVVALWGFGAGMLVSLGVAAGIVGLQSVTGLLIITQYEMPLVDGLGRAGLVLLGGLVQVVLLLTVWPLRRSPAERRALAEVYRSLAAYTAALPDGHLEPPDGGPLVAARAALRDPQPFLRDEQVAVFAGLHDEAERVRTTLAGLAVVRDRLSGHPDREPAVQCLDALAADAAGLLRDIAGAAELPRSAARVAALAAVGPSQAPQRWAGPAAATAALRTMAAQAGPAQGHVGASLIGEVERLATALLGHLEAVARLSGAASGPLRAPLERRGLAPAWRSALPTLRAHLTLRSTVLRHALRLSGALGIGTAGAALLPFEHRYWLPLTALVVLKPDFRSTFSRGLGRIAGTVAGAALTSGVAAVLRPGPLLLTLLVVLTAWGCYTFLFANYALFGLFVTGFVVFLLSVAELPTAGTVLDRIEATVLGGALALLAYAVWPTWERVRVPEQLARLLEAQSRYGAVLLEQYAHFDGEADRRDLAALEGLRAAARSARSNAEASVDRVRDEPAGRRTSLPLAQASGAVTAVRAFALAALALQAHLPQAGPVAVRAPLLALADAVRTALAQLADGLRTGDQLPGPPPGRSLTAPLVAAQDALHSALDARVRADPTTALDAAVLDVETAALVDSLTALAEVLAGPPAPEASPAVP